MARRSLWREIVLVSAPLLLISGVFWWSTWQKRLQTPRIALSVGIQPYLPPYMAYNIPPDLTLGFSSDVAITGGPKPGYRLGWNEAVVAKTPRGSVVVWQNNGEKHKWGAQDGKSGFSGVYPVRVDFESEHSLNRFTYKRDYSIETTMLPLDTQSVEWRGAIAAVPISTDEVAHMPVSLQTVQNWRHLPGAVSWNRTQALDYDPQQHGAVVVRKKSNGSRAEFHIEVATRAGNWRSYRRLVAFDGTTRRTLWTEGDYSNTVFQRVSYFAYLAHPKGLMRHSEHFACDLRKVPASWGEVTFLCDTVYDLTSNSPAVRWEEASVGEKALATFQKQTNGWRVSRRLVIRP